MLIILESGCGWKRAAVLEPRGGRGMADDRKMKRYSRVSAIFLQSVFLAALTILGTAEYSFAFRCGTSLVSEGDTRAEVAHKCGDPDYIDSWEEERISRDFRGERSYDPRTRSYRYNREPFLVKEKVKIDVWTYNLGATEFTRYLTFENGILTEITTGDKGY